MLSDLQNNINKAQTYLAAMAKTGVRNRIGGEDLALDAGETFEVSSPVDGSKLLDCAKGTAADIDKAAAAAKAAFPAWRDMGGKERKKILHAIADKIVERAGPDHAPNFMVELTVDGYESKVGWGASRRKAEQVAAEKMLKDLGIEL